MFDDNSPFAKKGGRFSGSGGLFDDVIEDKVDDRPAKVCFISKNLPEA